MGQEIKLNGGNYPLGSTDNYSVIEMQKKLQSLTQELDSPSAKEEPNFTNLKSIVGKPIEKDIPLTELRRPPEHWTKLFKKASENDVEKMAASIYRYGLLHRVTLWENSEGQYVILGGMTRTAAFEYLSKIYDDEKWKKIPARVYSFAQLDEIDANRIFIISNTDQRRMSIKAVAQAYLALVKLEKEKSFYGSGIVVVNVAKQVGLSRSSFYNYLKLLELYPPLLTEIDNGKFPLVSAFEIVYAPEDIQKYVYDKKYYLNMKRKTARRIRHEAFDYKTVDKIIRESLKQNRSFNYRVDTRRELPRNCEILPLFVNKNSKEQIIEILAQAIDESTLSDEIKLELHENLGI